MVTRLALVFLLGCASSTERPTGGADGGADADANTESDASSPDSDLATFQQILDGEITALEGLTQISLRGGLPIETPDGFLFVAIDDGAGPLRLAGDLNEWQPAEMTAGPGIFHRTESIATPDESLYKFVDESERYFADPLARRYGFDEFGEISIVRSSVAHRERWPIVTPSDVALATRTVRAWVPAGTATRHVYVHDGQNLFRPDAAFGGWRLHETAPSDALVIGIDNTADRIDEYTPNSDSLGGGPVGGKGDAYANFVATEVIGLVETRYGEPIVRAVMGSSLGGLIAYHQALLDPTLFQLVASLSGTMGWGSIAGSGGETVISRMAIADKLPAVLYLDSGGQDGGGCEDSDGDGINDDAADSDNYCVNRQLADLLATRGYEFGVDLHHWHEPGAEHNEAAWAARAPMIWALLSAL